jgi:hypothetical protein
MVGAGMGLIVVSLTVFLLFSRQYRYVTCISYPVPLQAIDNSASSFIITVTGKSLWLFLCATAQCCNSWINSGRQYKCVVAHLKEAWAREPFGRRGISRSLSCSARDMKKTALWPGAAFIHTVYLTSCDIVLGWKGASLRGRRLDWWLILYGVQLRQ